MEIVNLPNNIRKLAVDSGYEYIRTKALRFIAIGAKAYRKTDALGMPDTDLESEDIDLLMLGCRQVAEYKGLSYETAFEGLGIFGFYQLMELFHYTSENQAIIDNGEDWIMDKMLMKHLVTHQKIVLFNKVTQK